MTNLEDLYRTKVAELSAKAERLPWENQEFYAYWLGQTYYFVNHSTRLVTLASARLPLDQGNTRRRFVEHAKEEWGHEKLALNDLKHLDWSIKNIPELASTAGLYQSQYYWIEHVNPVAFFGYILLLEGLAIEGGKAIYKTIANKYSPKTGSFLRLHAEEDVDHIQKALNEISQLGADDIELVKTNLNQTSGSYSLILDEILARTGAGQTSKAA